MEFLMGNPKILFLQNASLRRSGAMRVIRKLTGILVDNAVKYADEGGEMRPKSGNRRQILHKFNRKIIRIGHRIR